ncbi:MAG: lamin tail domain-containing protein, partial [Planctomycetes bacterium]|nr:lamin tail domain-containing protein [Planctomycetota bacterium]
MLRTLRRLPLLLAIWGSPILPAHEIVISEIQYHPHGNLPEDEFLEIENRGTAGVDLSGWFFSAGVRLAFPSGTSIEPGEALVISPDAASTAARYGIEASRVIGGLEGRLDNDGEVIALCDASGHQVTRVHYRDRGGWPEEADGLGPSLELLPGFWDPDLPESWRSSRRVRGTPGEPTVLEEEGPSSRAAVPAASEWRYFEGESEPAPGDPLAWTRIGFDDSSWPRGQQPIGFGSAEVRTEIAAMWGGFLSLYMRCDFDLTSAEVDLIESGLAEISLAVRYDDGFVAYVNGTEVLRQNVGGSPGEPVPFDAQALEPQDGTRASILPASGLLRAGANTVALQGVNRSLFSGDFILGATVQLSIAALVGDSPIALRINEVRPSAGPGPGFIEIHNPGRQRRSLAGYRLTDSPYRDDPFVFPAGAAVDAGGWLSVRASELGFDLPQETRVYLLVDPEGNLADAFESAPALPEHSSVRHPDGSGRTYSTPTPTEGAANEFQPDERLVINEIHYHPADDPAGDLEFIEIVNRSGAPVSLRGWRLSEAVDFSFPDDASIAPLEFLVVARNPEAMRSRYGLSRVLGPFEGRLANDEERIQLRDAFDNVVSRVHYADDGAWPTAADGEGPSLELVNADLDNEYAAVWRAGPPGGTPGVGNASYRAEVAP